MDKQSCTICGKELKEDDQAYATTTGYISEEVGGFRMSDTDPWLTVACGNCGGKISDLISRLMPEKIKGEIRLMVPLYDKASTEVPARKLAAEIILSDDISIEVPEVPTAPNCENEAILIECCDDKLQLRAWDDTQEDPVTSKNWERITDGSS